MLIQNQNTDQETVRVGSLIHRAALLTVNKGGFTGQSVTISPSKQPDKVDIKLVIQKESCELTISNALWTCALILAMNA